MAVILHFSTRQFTHPVEDENNRKDLPGEGQSSLSSPYTV